MTNSVPSQVSCVVQVFYAHRIHMLSKIKSIAICVTVVRAFTSSITTGYGLLELLKLAVVQCVAGIATGVLSLRAKAFTDLETQVHVSQPVCLIRLILSLVSPKTQLWTVSSMICDILIAASMSYLVRQAPASSMGNSTDHHLAAQKWQQKYRNTEYRPAAGAVVYRDGNSH